MLEVATRYLTTLWLTSLAEGCCPSGAAVKGRLSCGWLSGLKGWGFTEETEKQRLDDVVEPGQSMTSQLRIKGVVCCSHKTKSEKQE